MIRQLGCVLHSWRVQRLIECRPRHTCFVQKARRWSLQVKLGDLSRCVGTEQALSIRVATPPQQQQQQQEQEQQQQQAQQAPARRLCAPAEPRAPACGCRCAALGALGERCGSCPALDRACAFLLQHQREDGGWGESYLSCQNKVRPALVLHVMQQLVVGAWLGQCCAFRQNWAWGSLAR